MAAESEPPAGTGRRGAALSTWMLRTAARRGGPRSLIYIEGGLGDALCLSTVARELSLRGVRPWIMSDYPALFDWNPDIAGVIPPRAGTIGVRKGLCALARWSGGSAFECGYARFIPEEDRDEAPPDHILACMCRKVSITGPVGLRPYLTLTALEKERGRLYPRQVAVQTSGAGAVAHMQNKDWFADRFQEVVNALPSDYEIVQIGLTNDPLLEGVRDLRGRTGLRETAAILSQSVVFVGHVGFLMHLARAVDCRAVIIYGGREAPDQSGYVCNANLYTSLPCSPCWFRSRCDFGRECMKQIEARDVIAAIHRQVARQGQPLEVETLCLDASTLWKRHESGP